MKMATLMQARQREEQNWKNVSRSVDPATRGSSIVPFAAEAIRFATDPLNTVGFTAAWKGIGWLGAKAAARSANITRILNSMRAVKAGRIAIGAAKGSAIGATEATIQNEVLKSHADNFGLTFTDEEARNNLIMGTLLGGAFGAIFGGIGPSKNQMDQARRDIDAIDSGKMPDSHNSRNPNNGSRLYDRDRSANRDILKKHLAGTDKAEGDSLFSVHKTTDGTFNLDNMNMLGVKVRGKGLIVTRSKDLANNMASSSLQAGSVGHVLTNKINLSKLNFLDLDKALPTRIAEKITSAVRRIIDHPGLLDNIQEAVSGGKAGEVLQAMDRLEIISGNSKANSEIEKILKKEFDGYRFSHLTENGDKLEIDGNEGFMIFDSQHSIVDNIEEITHDADNINSQIQSNDVIQEDIDYYSSERSNLMYDKETEDLYAGMSPMPDKIEEPSSFISKVDTEVIEGTEKIDSAFERTATTDIQKVKGFQRVPDYKYKKFDAKNPTDRTFFHSGTTPSLKHFDSSMSSDDVWFGKGLYFTDDFNESASYIVRMMKQQFGKQKPTSIFHVKMKKGIKLATLNELKMTPSSRKVLDTYYTSMRNQVIDNAVSDSKFVSSFSRHDNFDSWIKEVSPRNIDNPKLAFRAIRIEYREAVLDGILGDTKFNTSGTNRHFTKFVVEANDSFSDAMLKQGFDGMHIESNGSFTRGKKNEIVIFNPEKVDLEKILTEVEPPKFKPNEIDARQVAKAAVNCVGS